MAKSHLLPSVSEVLKNMPESLRLPPPVATRIIRNEISMYRNRLQQGNRIPDRETIVQTIVEKIIEQQNPSLKPVINGTGIVLHTGFGRAPLAHDVLTTVAERVTGYVNLEYDLTSGRRGNRLDHIRTFMAAMCGTEDSLVVNNNAAAVLLTLNSLAAGKEVIISRGQMVEIGGSFRIPDIIAKSGCILKEVGTTNRTHLRDYENVITKNTGCLLWVHTSNYKVQGFTADVPLSALVELGKRKRIPVVADLGSGALIAMNDLGLPDEIPVGDVVKSGVSLVTFSGDKLLGGPQSGFVAGRASLIKRLEKNPYYRTFRCDKLILATVEEILRTYHPSSVDRNNLALHLLQTSRSELMERGHTLLTELSRDRDVLNITLRPSVVEAGSGSLPTEKIESMALSFQPGNVKTNQLAKYFRLADPPVIGYVEHNTFYIDLKAVLPEQYSDLVSVIRAVAKKIST